MSIWIRLLALLALLFSSRAFGQEAPLLRAAATRANDLLLPTEPSPLPQSVPQMAVHKPDGPGPFPALVLHHQCSGLVSPGFINQSMLNWAGEALSRGYVVLILDSFGQRGVDSMCKGPKGGVNFARGVRDALQAAEHLRKFAFVDKRRIAHVGYSWGAMVGVLASSKAWSTAVGPNNHFAAFVSFYPGCHSVQPPQGAPFEIVRADINRSLLVLMGGKDNETPSGDCVSKLSAAKVTGAPVEWHVYQDATHCWDCKNLDGFSKIDFRGSHVVYRYDESATADSRRRMFEFIEGIRAGNR